MSRHLAVLLMAAAALGVRLGFQQGTPSQDEAGLVMVAAQWGDGRSLYGDYWVDRPPGLIAICWLAHVLGGVGPLRLLASVAAAAATLAAAALGAVAAPGHRWAPAVCAAAVTALAANPLLDVDEVSAEVLGLPFLLAGIAAAVAAARPERRSWEAVAWAAAAGAAGAAACSVKQSLLGVWLVGAVLAVALVVRGERRRAAGMVAGALCGAVLVAGPLLALAWWRGTSLPALWEAVFWFRLEAGDVIADHATEATYERAWYLAGIFLATGMPAVLLLLLAHVRGPRPEATADGALLAACLVLLAWEGFAVLAGGSYWPHYLLLPVPGLTLLIAVTLARTRAAGDAEQRRWARITGWAIAPAVVSTAVGLVLVAGDRWHRSPEDQAVVDFLAEHRARGASAVVAFGSPAVLHDAGMSSPYEHLWSLPVRVRDPDLRDFVRVLRSDRRPVWVVRVGDSLTSWGIDAERADRVLGRLYRPVFESGDYTVLAVRGSAPERERPPP